MNLSKEQFQVETSPPVQDSTITSKEHHYWKDVKNRLIHHKGALFGLIFIVILSCLAIFAPMFSSYSYKDQELSRAKLPPKIPVLEHVSFLPFDGKNAEGIDVYKEKNIDTYFWFGTDDLGRDLWTRTWEGTRVSLMIGLLAAAIDLFIGITYGSISGYFGGRVDTIMQRITEVLNGIPYLIMVILLILIFKDPGIFTLALAMAIVGWIGMSRIVRGQILKLKEQEYILAARTLGASHKRIVIKHLFPNVMGPVIVMTMFTIPGAIFSEAFLSFIGLGINPPLASLGSLVNDGAKMMQVNPYMLAIPATVISLLILSFNLLADGLRDALDPKMKD